MGGGQLRCSRWIASSRYRGLCGESSGTHDDDGHSLMFEIVYVLHDMQYLVAWQRGVSDERPGNIP